MERLVGLFDLLDPHIKRVKFLFNQIIEVIGSVEDTVDGSHKEGEESKTHELQGNRENVFLGSGSRVVSVTDSCNDLKDPVEGKDVLGMVSLVVKVIFKDPRLSAVLFFVIVSIIRNIWVNSAVFKTTDHKPNAGHDMAQVNDIKDKSSETGQIVLSFL
jgi:hypothetical protein